MMKFLSKINVFMLMVGMVIQSPDMAWAQYQTHIDHAPEHGLFVDNPGQVGIVIDSAIIGAQVIAPSLVGLGVAYSGYDGIKVYRSGANGILIDSSQANGIGIQKIAEHGVEIEGVGFNGIDIKEVHENGIRIKEAYRGIDILDVEEGVRVSGSNGNGVTVQTPFANGIEVVSAGQNGAYIRNTEGQGVHINNTGSNGILINEAGSNGVRIEDPVGAGVSLENSGQQGVLITEPGSHGVHVIKAQGNGILLSKTDEEGILMHSPGMEGILIDSSGGDGVLIHASGDDGVTVINPVDDGINVVNAGNDGIHVNGAGQSAAVFVTSATSTNASVHITHGDDTKPDLAFGGNGQMEVEDNYELQLDANDDIANATFIIRNSDGQVPVIATEEGDLGILGHLSKGSGSFKIDHPLDPKNKYLYHSFVESPDMMNIYNGNITLDEHGEAEVRMPDWFNPLNRDFRYQLTAIGDPAVLYIKEEIDQGVFAIGGGKPGLKVSWQVTGIRQDRYANKYRLPVEVDKEASKRGTYLHPDAWEEVANGQPVTNTKFSKGE